MEKERLKILLDEFKDLCVAQIEENRQWSEVVKELLYQHSNTAYTEFQTLVDESDNERIDFKLIKDKLSHLWMGIQGSSLSYTAMPDVEVTKFLVKVACESLSENSKPKEPTLIDVIELLMPSLIFPDRELSCPNDFKISREKSENTTKDTTKDIDIFEGPSKAENIPPLAFSSEEPKDVTIRKFLKTHLIADNGQYVIPLWILNDLKSNIRNKEVKNVYYDFQSHERYAQKNPDYLSLAEIERLFQHNTLSLSIMEAIEPLKEATINKFTLLGWINLLADSLYLNSKDGLGFELEAGKTAELSIRKFFEDLKKLDQNQLTAVLEAIPDLKIEFMKLRHCIGIYEPNEDKITNIETCLATRRDKLLTAVRGNEFKLSQVSLTNQGEVKAYSKNKQEDLWNYFELLNQELINYESDGHENLPVTPNLLSYCNYELEVKDCNRLRAILNELSPEIIEKLVPKYLQNWLSVMDSVNDMALVCTGLPKEKMQILGPHLMDKLEEFSHDSLSTKFAFLSIFNYENQKILIKQMIESKMISVSDHILNFSHDENLLFLASNQAELFSLFWELLSKQECLVALELLDKHNNNLIHSVSNNLKNTQLVFSSFQNECIKKLKAQNTELRTGIHFAAANNDQTLEFFLDLFKWNDRAILLNEKDKKSATPLQYAAQYNPKAFDVALNALPQKKRLKALQEKDDNFVAVIHYAAADPRTLDGALEKLLLKERIALLDVLDKKSLNFMHYAVRTPETLKAALNRLPKKMWLKALLSEDSNSRTVIHYATLNPTILAIALEGLSKKERKELLKAKDKDSCTFMHYAVNDPEAFEVALNALTKEAKRTALQAKDKKGYTVMNYASKDANTLEIVLAGLSPQEQISVLKTVDINLDTVMHYAASDHTLFKIMSDRLPKTDLVKLVTSQNNAKKTPLHIAIKDLVTFKALFETLPENERLMALAIPDKENKTVLDCVNKWEVFKYILESLPQNKRLDILTLSDNKTVINALDINATNVLGVLKLLPKAERIKFLNFEDKNGKKVLNYILKGVDNLKDIFNLLPKNELLRLVSPREDQHGFGVLHHVLHDSSCFKIILDALPTQQTQPDQEAESNWVLIKDKLHSLVTNYQKKLEKDLNKFREENTKEEQKAIKEELDIINNLSLMFEERDGLNVSQKITKYFYLCDRAHNTISSNGSTQGNPDFSSFIRTSIYMLDPNLSKILPGVSKLNIMQAYGNSTSYWASKLGELKEDKDEPIKKNDLKDNLYKGM